MDSETASAQGHPSTSADRLNRRWYSALGQVAACRTDRAPFRTVLPASDCCRTAAGAVGRAFCSPGFCRTRVRSLHRRHTHTSYPTQLPSYHPDLANAGHAGRVSRRRVSYPRIHRRHGRRRCRTRARATTDVGPRRHVGRPIFPGDHRHVIVRWPSRGPAVPSAGYRAQSAAEPGTYPTHRRPKVLPVVPPLTHTKHGAGHVPTTNRLLSNPGPFVVHTPG